MKSEKFYQKYILQNKNARVYKLVCEYQKWGAMIKKSYQGVFLSFASISFCCQINETIAKSASRFIGKYPNYIHLKKTVYSRKQDLR